MAIMVFLHLVRIIPKVREPALGIFQGSFLKHSGEKGDYYSVAWDWREREVDEEIEQLEQIVDFLAANPKLVDL
ncbi:MULTISPECIES: hypothetical protein [unclassified Microcystis]|jgi:thymidylate synthase|uniref:hypothetical protein n=1 Tax=unclassified Microcystis TaxID=2643300 RepID=UPI0022BD79ED|nr:hypothetical protein [Microcystis sp. LE19-84.1B]MCZ8225923.1 hypothetical protein [Microcystis sp. LE19-84.1B]